MRIHKEPETCQAARIFPRSNEARRLIKRPKYIKDELQPAIKLLISQEETRKKGPIKPELQHDEHDDGDDNGNDNDNNADNNDDNTKSNKRRLEDVETENQQAAKKRKQDTDKELRSLVGELQSLRRFVDEQMVTPDLEIMQRFNKLEAEILELMAAEI